MKLKYFSILILFFSSSSFSSLFDENFKGFLISVDLGPALVMQKLDLSNLGDSYTQDDYGFKPKFGVNAEVGVGYAFNNHIGAYLGFPNLITSSEGGIIYYNNSVIGIIAKKNKMIFKADAHFSKNKIYTNLSASRMLNKKILLGLNLGYQRHGQINAGDNNYKYLIPIGLKIGVLIF